MPWHQYGLARNGPQTTGTTQVSFHVEEIGASVGSRRDLFGFAGTFARRGKAHVSRLSCVLTRSLPGWRRSIPGGRARDCRRGADRWCGTWFCLRWRTYDVRAAWLRRSVVLWPVRPATSTRSTGLVATLTPTFLLPHIEGPTATVQRLGPIPGSAGRSMAEPGVPGRAWRRRTHHPGR